MNVMLSFKNNSEAHAIEEALNEHRLFTQVINTKDVDFVIEQLKIGYASTAIIDIELIKNCYMETLNSISDVFKVNPEAKIVLVGGENEDVMASAAFRFGVNYVILRPFSVDMIINRVIDLNKNPLIISEESERKAKNNKVERVTSSILTGTGILPNLKGYKYLKEAIVIGYNDTTTLEAITKFLYPEIAKNNNTSSERVERAIRHAIESAWNKCGGNGFYSKMGFVEAYRDKRPTNSEYIFSVVEYLKNQIL